MSELRDEGVYLSSEAYKERFGSTCPNCGSDQLEGNAIYIDTGAAHQEVSCTNCGSTWDDDYVLTGYARLNVEVELDIAACSEFVLDHLIHHKAMPTVFQQNGSVDFDFDVFSPQLPAHIHTIANHLLQDKALEAVQFDVIQNQLLQAPLWVVRVADEVCAISSLINADEARVFESVTLPIIQQNNKH